MRKTDLPDWIAETLATLPPIATPAEVGKAIRVSERSVRRLVNTGQLRSIRNREAGSARVLIPREAVGAYLATLETGATLTPLRAHRLA